MVKKPTYGELEQKISELEKEVSTKKQTEKALRERGALQKSERYFRSLLDSLHEGIMVIDRDYKISDTNNMYLIRNNHKREDVIGRHFYEVSHGFSEPCSRHGEKCMLHEVFETGEPRSCRHEHTGIDGSKHWVDILFSPLKDEKGYVIKVIEAIRNVDDLMQAEQAIQESEEKYRFLFDNSPDSIAVLSAEGYFLDINKKFVKESGYSKKEIIGKNFLTSGLLNESSGNVTKTYFEELIGGKKSVLFEIWGVIKDGTNIPYEISAVSTKKDGKTVAVQATLRNISDRKQTEDAIFREKQLGDSIINNAPLGIAFLNNDFVLQKYNSFYADIIRTYSPYTPEQALGMSYFNYVPSSHSQTKEWFNNVKETGKSDTRYGFKLVLEQDGQEKNTYWDTSVTPILNAGGITEGILILTQDITERKKSEKEIRESERKYRALISNIPGMIYRAGPDWSMDIFSNSEMLCGYSVDDSRIKKINWLDLIHPDDKPHIVEAASKMQEKPMSIFQEYRFFHKDERVRWTSDHKTSFFKKDGTFIGIDGICYDITDQKLVEEDRNRFQAQLLQSQKMEAIGVLAGGVAHDFNNLLTTIIGNAHLALADLRKHDHAYEYIEEIRRAGEKGANLTRQLLAFSRKQIIQPEILDINELLTGMEKMIGRLIREDVDLLMILAPDLWRAKVDPTQLEQVIMNLVINAGDAMPKGGKLTIETANRDLSKEYFIKHGLKDQVGNYVMMAVSDSGIGMDRELQKRVFEPFFTTKEQGKGTGLGLSTIYGIVKQNNGFIWIYSEPGQGSTFKVYLPRVKGEVDSKKEAIHPETASGGSETVLIVEDNDSLRNLVQKTLKAKGYQVLAAENGEDALGVIKEHDGSIDFVVTDVVMPKMGGLEIVKRLQALYPHIKVLYMSGYTDEAIVDHGILIGGVAFIEKPFTPEELARKVREILDKK